MKTIYIVASNRMTWGRGTLLWEAIGHALFHSNQVVDFLLVYSVKVSEDTTEEKVLVNSMGQIIAPSGSEVEDLGRMDSRDMYKKFYEFNDIVESLAFSHGMDNQRGEE